MDSTDSESDDSTKSATSLTNQDTDIHHKDSAGQTLVHFACRKGDIDSVKHFIEKYPEMMEVRDNKGLTPFLAAGHSGRIDLVELLIESGCAVNQTNNKGQTILHLACKNAKISLVKSLTKKYEELLSVRDKKGRTPFLVAGISGSKTLVRYLIEKGCDVNQTSSDGQTILHLACQEGKVMLVYHIAKTYPFLLETKDNAGLTPFLLAGKIGNVDLVYCLIFLGCNVYQKSYTGLTILHFACQEGKLDIVKCLRRRYKRYQKLSSKCFRRRNIKYQKLFSKRDNRGITPFLAAARSDNADLLAYLFKIGCDVDQTSNTGQTILHIACVEEKFESFCFIASEYPHLLTRRDQAGLTPFLTTGPTGNVHFVEKLIEYGCDINETTNTGQTILHLASQERNIYLIHYLVGKYPEMLSLKDNEGNTPFLASVSCPVHLIEFLILQDCDAFQQDNAGSNILDKACIHDNVELVSYLKQNYPALIKENIDDVAVTVFSGMFTHNILPKQEMLKLKENISIQRKADPTQVVTSHMKPKKVIKYSVRIKSLHKPVK